MIPTSVSEVLCNVPDGIAPELRRQRLSALLGLTVSSLVQLPGAPLLGNPMDYFNENVAAYRNTVVGFNEATPFSLDITMGIAYRCWATRYSLVHELTPDLLLGGNVMRAGIADIVPNFEALCIKPADITTVIALIKSYMG